jgi:inorganic pyrophosphatase
LAYHPWHDVELPRYVEDPIPAIIEIPTGSKVKYELDKASGLLLVDRILFSAVHYPANYGFVPRTYCDDGDPLDILVLCQEPIQPLAVMRAKIIGVMKMRDDKGEDDKLISVHADDPNYTHYADVGELPPHRLRELQRFFQDYKALENKRVLVSAPQGRSEGLRVLRDAIRLYDQERDRLMAVPTDVRAARRPRRAGQGRRGGRVAAKARAARTVGKGRSPSHRHGRRPGS